MLRDEVLRLVVHPLDVGLKLFRLDAPLTAPADLDRGQVALAHECVDLRAGHTKHFRNIRQRQKAWRHGGQCGTPSRREPRSAHSMWTTMAAPGRCGAT